MQTVESLFDNLWSQYVSINPQAHSIHKLLEQRGEHVINDHIALRTFDHPHLNVDAIAQVFVNLGYEKMGEYTFEEKKLDAAHYQHLENPHYPKVFISELKTELFSDELQSIIGDLTEQVPQDAAAAADFIYSGRPWHLNFSEYIRLLQESEYAAWTAAYGYCANHFTVSLNHLTTFFQLQDLNQFLKDAGFKLNDSGSEIKGSPASLLEQSSTMAPLVRLQFDDSEHVIPGCFYEFAKRYPMPDGRLFQGFIAANADKIFESTNVKA